MPLKKNKFHPDPQRLEGFLLLTLVIQALLAAGWSALGGVSQAGGYLGLSITRWLMVALLGTMALVMLAAAAGTRKSKRISTRLLSLLYHPRLKVSLVTCVLLTAGALWALSPSPQAIARLLPLLVFLWLASAEVILFLAHQFGLYPVYIDNTEIKGSGWVAALTLVCLYLALCLPARVIARLDGLPLNSPIEFVLALLVLPLAALLGWQVFAQRKVLALALLVLVLKMFLFVAAPANGLSMKVYTTSEAMQAGQYARTYDGYFNQSDSFTLRGPLEEQRAFPLEWINVHGYDLNQTWLGLHLEGMIELNGSQRLVLQAQGAIDHDASLTALANGQAQTLPVMLTISEAGTSQPVAAGWYRLSADLIYAGDADYHLVPYLINEGYAQPIAFDRLWLPGQTPPGKAQTNIFKALAWLVDLTLLSTCLILLLAAYARLFRGRLINWADLLLAASGLLAFAVLRVLTTQHLQAGLGWILLTAFVYLAISKWRWLHHHANWRGYLAALAPAFLLTFLLFDLDRTALVEFFPTMQDNLSYQLFARQIFLGGDALALSLNPHAYKLLFPYLVGLLHILTGQSSAALFFFNVWCALLSATLIYSLLVERRVAVPIAVVVSYIFIAILCSPLLFIFYFRFGLIEPLALLGFLLILALAGKGHSLGALIIAIITLLLRFDYAGGILPALVLADQRFTGSLTLAWRSLLGYVRGAWRVYLPKVILAITPVVFFILLFRALKPGYVLNAADTRYTAILDRLAGVLNILNGGRPEELTTHFSQSPIATAALIMILLAGGALTLINLVWRPRWLAHLGLGWSLIFIGFLSVYLVVAPTGYSPRFSLPFVVLALIMLILAFTKPSRSQIE